ncbi:MAG: hypothetical protein K2G58_01825, partial [Alistipes sp.]|nr:hypothetical protein [Alistipes sp.]
FRFIHTEIGKNRCSEREKTGFGLNGTKKDADKSLIHHPRPSTAHKEKIKGNARAETQAPTFHSFLFVQNCRGFGRLRRKANALFMFRHRPSCEDDDAE